MIRGSATTIRPINFLKNIKTITSLRACYLATHEVEGMNYFKRISLVLGTLLVLQNGHAAVSTISSEEFAQYGREDAYWVFTVQCTDDDKGRIVQRKTDGSLWCGKDIEGFCDDDKNAAAEKVCSSEYSQALINISEQQEQQQQTLADQQRAEKRATEERQRAARARERAATERAKAAEQRRQAAAEELRRNEISIEQKILELEQQELELRRKELEIQRRAEQAKKK